MFVDNMKYFKRSEFREWADLMDEELLRCLDTFRELWDAPVVISPHPDALGRELDFDDASMHNVTRYGKVKAVDFFPQGMDTKWDMQRAFEIAKEAGFTGIGLYTDTRPSNMMHGDVRSTRDRGNPATWARVKGEYLAIKVVIG